MDPLTMLGVAVGMAGLGGTAWSILKFIPSVMLEANDRFEKWNKTHEARLLSLEHEHRETVTKVDRDKNEMVAMINRINDRHDFESERTHIEMDRYKVDLTNMFERALDKFDFKLQSLTDKVSAIYTAVHKRTDDPTGNRDS